MAAARSSRKSSSCRVLIPTSAVVTGPHAPRQTIPQMAAGPGPSESSQYTREALVTPSRKQTCMLRCHRATMLVGRMSKQLQCSLKAIVADQGSLI